MLEKKERQILVLQWLWMGLVELAFTGLVIIQYMMEFLVKKLVENVTFHTKEFSMMMKPVRTMNMTFNKNRVRLTRSAQGKTWGIVSSYPILGLFEIRMIKSGETRYTTRSEVVSTAPMLTCWKTQEEALRRCPDGY